MNLINDIRRGAYVIPEVQREFVWDNVKVQDLWDSIYNGFPVGTITVWKIPAEFRNNETFRDVTIPIDRRFDYPDNVEYVVIDGLQRLSSIILGFEGVLESPTLEKKRLSTLCFNPYTKTVVRDARPKKKRELFPIHEILKAGAGNINRLIEEKERLGIDYNDTERSMITESLSEFYLKVMNYQIGHYVLDWSGDILEIFEKMTKCFTLLNTKQTRVKAPTLLIALLTGRLRKEMGTSFKSKCKEILEGFEEWSELIDEFVLGRAFIAISVGKCEFNEALRELEEFKGDEILKALDKTSESLRSVVKVLGDLKIYPSFIRSKYQLVPLAYLAYKEGIRRENYDKVEKWLVLSSFEDRYIGGRFTQLFGEDFKGINMNGIDGLLSALTLKSLSENIIFERDFGVAHKLLYYLLYLKNGARDWDLSAQRPKMIKNISTADLTIHHIFPRTVVDSADHPANITLISKEANKQIGDREPHEYLKRLSYIDNRGCIQAHFIPEDEILWYRENYEDFLRERQKLIIKAIKDMNLVPIT